MAFVNRFADQPWSVEDHVLRAYADQVDPDLGDLITDAVLTDVVGAVPEEWLGAPEQRAAYVAFLAARRDGHRVWLPKRGAA